MVHGAHQPWTRDHGRYRRDSHRAGFTLIEILVATTILLLIVMMMSMVFQQSSGAFQSGTNRVNAQKVLRNILGVIARDMTLAVDSAQYPGLKDKQKFGKTGVAFVALTGNPDAAGRRSPQWIEFSFNGAKVTRSCADLQWRGGQWTAGTGESVIVNPDYDLTDFKFDPPTDTLPLRVDIEGRLTTKGQFAFIRGRSAGKDREWDTDDDIVVGGQ